LIAIPLDVDRCESSVADLLRVVVVQNESEGLRKREELVRFFERIMKG